MSTSQRLSPLAAVGGFLLLSFLLYARILPNFFLADDYVLLGKLFLDGFYLSWGPHPGGFFRPLTVLSYWADLRLWGLVAWGYHFTNIFIHGLNGWLLFALGRAWLRFFQIPDATARALALAAGLLFLVLPCHTEAVTYISGRNDILAAGFGLAALWSGLAYLAQPRRPLLAGCLAALACALLSKESALAIPPMLFGLGALAVRGRLKNETGRASGPALMLGSMAVLAAYLAARGLALGTFIGAYGANVHLNLLSKETFSHLLIFGLRTFLPALPLSWQQPLSALGAGNTAAILLALFIAALWPFRRCPLPARTEAWLGGSLLAAFLAALAPVVAMQPRLFVPEGERLLYLPSAFACLAAMAGLYLLFRPKPAWKWVAAGWCLVSALALQYVNERWVGAGRLALQTLESTSNQISQPRVLVLNAPDNYRGALIFRLGFVPGLLLFEKLKVFARLQPGLRDPVIIRLQELNKEYQRLASRIAPGTIPPRPLSLAMQSLQSEQARLQSPPKIQAWLSDLRNLKAMLSVREVYLASTFDAFSPEDQVLVSQEPDYVYLTLQTPGAFFRYVSPSAPIVAERVTPQRLRISRACLPGAGTDILYYSQGKMHRLAPDSPGRP